MTNPDLPNTAHTFMRPPIPPELVLPTGLNAEALKDLHPLVPMLLETIVKLTSDWRTQTLEVTRLSAAIAQAQDENSALVAQIVGHGEQSKH